MENVVDILKFSEAFLGRYALGRLVSMNYQARIGMMAAGSYGVPQFRMRVFLWGAHPSEVSKIELVYGNISYDTLSDYLPFYFRNCLNIHCQLMKL